MSACVCARLKYWDIFKKSDARSKIVLFFKHQHITPIEGIQRGEYTSDLNDSQNQTCLISSCGPYRVVPEMGLKARHSTCYI